ncbi:MAG: hypothetical protein WEB50_00315, partial [Vicinamibacterales bacterium]
MTRTTDPPIPQSPDLPIYRSTVTRRLVVTLLIFGGLAVTAILLGPLVGSTSISLARVFDRS